MGINTLTFDKSNDGETPEGIGFAIPTVLASKIMDKLIRDGCVIRGYIGITGRELSVLHNQGSRIDHVQGIIVSVVTPSGPAEKAGIQVNDVLLSVNGKPPLSAQDTIDQVAEIHPGSVIQVEVLRNDQKLTLPVTIQEFPDSGKEMILRTACGAFADGIARPQRRKRRHPCQLGPTIRNLSLRCARCRANAIRFSKTLSALLPMARDALLFGPYHPLLSFGDRLPTAKTVV